MGIVERDLERAYKVVRYSRAAAKRALIDAGCSDAIASSNVAYLPNDFPIVTHATGGQQPVAFVLHYILQKWIQPKKGMVGPRSLNSANAAAYDAMQMLEHLDYHGYSYDMEIDQPIFDLFVTNLNNTVSQQTGQQLARSTIERRATTVADLFHSDHFSKIGNATFDAALAPIGGRITEPVIHPLTVDQWRALAKSLGPLPSAASTADTSVMRLFAEWSLRTGARREEVATITVDQVLRPQIDPNAPDGSRLIKTSKTKGRVPRNIWVPVDVLEESRAYIRNERAALVTGPDHEMLFVNPRRSTHRRGMPVLLDTVTGWFRDAIMDAGLVRRFVDPKRENFSVNRFVLHDLRHTSAVWTYVALQMAGVQRPWKIVQARLGHRHLLTTETIYLAHIEEQEAEISAILESHHKHWMEA
jgi:integrase